MGKVSAAPFPSPESRKPLEIKKPKPSKKTAEVIEEIIEAEDVEQAAE
jgi:hypothetical protein